MSDLLEKHAPTVAKLAKALELTRAAERCTYPEALEAYEKRVVGLLAAIQPAPIVPPLAEEALDDHFKVAKRAVVVGPAGTHAFQLDAGIAEEQSADE